PPKDLNDLARSYVDAVAILYFFLIFLPFHNTSLRTKDICILTVNKQHHITPHILYTKVVRKLFYYLPSRASTFYFSIQFNLFQKREGSAYLQFAMYIIQNTKMYKDT